MTDKERERERERETERQSVQRKRAHVIFINAITHISQVENQNDLELDFKVFFFADYCCSDIVLDESN